MESEEVGKVRNAIRRRAIAIMLPLPRPSVS